MFFDECIELNMKEAYMKARVEECERHLKWCQELVREAAERLKQVKEEQAREHAMKLAREEADRQELTMKQMICNWDE